MNRTHVLVAIVALLSIAALAIAAATVDVPRSGDPGYGDGTGGGVGDQTGEAVRTPQGDGPTLSVPPLLALIGIAAMAVLFVLMTLYFLWSADLRKVVRFLVAGAVVVLLCWIVFSLLPFALPEAQVPGQQPQEQPNASGGGSGDIGQQNPRDTDRTEFEFPLALVGLVGLFAIALAVTIVRFSGSETPSAVAPVGPGGGDDGGGGVRAVGEAAGRAADEIDDPGVDMENAVYRAWEEMTAALEVPQAATTTPTEFADAAVEAGMDPDDVRELTTLFEEVRYGDRPVTDARERRAEAALRRIEDAYARAGDGDE